MRRPSVLSIIDPSSAELESRALIPKPFIRKTDTYFPNFAEQM